MAEAIEGRNRRAFLRGAAAMGGALAGSRVVAPRGAGAASEGDGTDGRAFRFVHFGDTHVGDGIPFCATPDGYPKALAHVRAMDDAPEFILHTGDVITDAFWASRESAQAQWALYRRLMDEHCPIPVRYTIGNHDVNFGWDPGDAAGRFTGKGMALEQLGLESPYHSFDHGGWHFVVLDNTQPGGWNGFQHFLDEEQFAWLERDLAATDPATPVVVASHAPILTVTCFFEPRVKQHPDGMVITNDGVHQDVVRIFELFRRHPNVKLCLSGHYHQVDHCRYLGVDFICGGAVCADYWKAPLPYRPEHEAGYGVVDLFRDGTFEYRYVDYGLVGYRDEPGRERYPWPNR